MSTTQQKALFLVEKFGALEVRSTSIPEPGPGELFVKNGAVALNPVDWKIQKYGFAIETFPSILGLDLAGTVEKVGEGVTAFQKGDKVVAIGTYNNRQAAFQQYSVTSAKYSAKLPDSVSVEQASTIPVGLSTAAVGLYQKGNFGAGLTAPWEQDGKEKFKGKPFFVLGGSSSVGAYVIQLAKLSGFSPIITTASPHNRKYLETLGATHVLDRHQESAALKKEVEDIAKAPFEVVYDTVSEADTQKLGFELLAENGTLVLVLPSSLGDNTGGKTVKSTQGSPFVPGNEQILEGLYANLHGYLDSGIVQTNHVEVLPNGLAGIVGGLERLRENKVSGTKLVARPQETP